MGGGVDRLGGLGLLGDDRLARQAVVAGALDDRDKPPPLRRRERPRFLDEDGVADVRLVRLVVRLNLVVRRMTRLYSRWRASRSTDTTIVLSILSLTTRPTFVFRLACTCGVLLLSSRDLPHAVRAELARSRCTVRIRAIVRRVWGIEL